MPRFICVWDSYINMENFFFQYTNYLQEMIKLACPIKLIKTRPQQPLPSCVSGSLSNPVDNKAWSFSKFSNKADDLRTFFM